MQPMSFSEGPKPFGHLATTNAKDERVRLAAWDMLAGRSDGKARDIAKEVAEEALAPSEETKQAVKLKILELQGGTKGRDRDCLLTMFAARRRERGEDHEKDDVRAVRRADFRVGASARR
jgi:hypothetical protein